MPFDVDRDIIFKLIGKKPKTKVYEVLNLHSNCSIGIIKWYPAWRHYCFFPGDETIFSDRCLLKIGIFIKELNEERRLKRFE